MKNTYKNPTAESRIVRHIEGLSKYSMFILKISLPIISAALLLFIGLMSSELEVIAGAASSRYLPIMEYILKGLMIAVAGALILDIADKSKKQKK